MSSNSLGSRLLRARVALEFSDGLTTPDGADDSETRPLPDYINFQLARMRLLHDIPFRYLVPDARLLPDESARFFTLDEAWLSQLVVGALSAAGSGTRELARAKAAAGEAELRSAQLRYSVRNVSIGRTQFELAATADQDVAPGTVSGMLIRSKLISQWPKFALRAWTTSDKRSIPDGADPDVLETNRPELVVPILRMERLSPSLLLVLFDGVPGMFWLEEPHGGVQFGFTEKNGGGFDVELRNSAGRETNIRVDTPMRAGAAGLGIVNISGLRNAIDQAMPLSAARGSAGLATQLLRPPARQRYES